MTRILTRCNRCSLTGQPVTCSATRTSGRSCAPSCARLPATPRTEISARPPSALCTGSTSSRRKRRRRSAREPQCHYCRHRVASSILETRICYGMVISPLMRMSASGVLSRAPVTGCIVSYCDTTSNYAPFERSGHDLHLIPFESARPAMALLCCWNDESSQLARTAVRGAAGHAKPGTRRRLRHT
eukprot:1018578-Pleurochrysis_carterae.AAC.3